MKLHDTLGACGIITLGGWVLWHVQRFPPMPGQKYGPAVYPGVIAVGLIACALVLIWRTRLPKSGEAWIALPEWARESQARVGVVSVIATLVLYTWLSETIGFLPLATALLIGLFLVFRTPLLIALITAPMAALAIHYAFYKLLRVPLPWGWLKSFAW